MTTKLESGAELLARLTPRGILLPSLNSELFSPVDNIVVGQRNIIEITGCEGSGKTELLLDFMCQCILPDRWKSVCIGGLGRGIIYMDLDYHFSMIRFVTILEERLRSVVKTAKKNPPCSNDATTTTDVVDTSLLVVQHNEEADEMDDLLKKCLKSFYLIRCGSTANLLITLVSLDTMITSNPNIAMLIIDSLSTFYWLDRYQSGPSNNFMLNLQKKLVKQLQKLVGIHNLTIITSRLTTQPHEPTAGEADQGWEIERNRSLFFPSEWFNLITHQYHLDNPGTFAVERGMSVNSPIVITERKPNQRILSMSINSSGILIENKLEK